MSANTSKLADYEWRSYYDDANEKRVSDWDRAENCARCGSGIVHVYTVVHASGAAEIVGRECAHKALGWRQASATRLRAVEAAFMVERANQERLRADTLASARRWGQGTQEGAIAACRLRNPFRGQPFVGDVWTYRKSWAHETLFYAVPEERETGREGGAVGRARSLVLLADGWERVEAPSKEALFTRDPGFFCRTCGGCHKTTCRLCAECKRILPAAQVPEDRRQDCCSGAHAEAVAN